MDQPLFTINSKRKSPADRAGLYIRTFGCLMNEYDSQKLATLLESDYQLVDAPEKAELILINTCSVREKPEHKLYSLLGEVKELKGDRQVMVGVGGCVAQQEGANILKKGRGVDFVFGTHNLSMVPGLVAQRKAGAPPQVAIDYRDDWEELPLGFPEVARVSALISISRGCNKNCTYCIVPTTRGREISRDPQEIEREVRIAVHRGAKEVVLLGQTVNSYGQDFSPRISFISLLESISQVAGLSRIRFTSPHPQEVKNEFIDFVAQNPKIAPHIHMPMQSGSDRILKLMNRNYRKKRYIEIISALKQKIPDMGITTDIIVGFPGETEHDFQETVDVMKELKFQNSYSFAFSKRPGTLAAEMEETVSHKEKITRLQTLQALQEQLSAEVLSRWVGETVEVLIDGPSKGDVGLMQGRSPQNILVNIQDQADGLLPGALVPVRITETARFSLRGESRALSTARESTI